ncbi:MAG: hypothetical protein HKO06_09785 [Pseudomonadales bacterium]|nr:hypothetical protein [Pseudomonadales bacterium]
MKKIAHTFTSLLTGLVCLLTASVATALDYSASLNFDAESQGDGRLDGTGRSEVVTRSGIDLEVSQDNPGLQLRGDYSYRFEHYENDTNSDRSSANGSSELVATLLEQRLSWLASHEISDISASRRDAADIGDDKRRRQQISTGPLITLPFSRADSVVLSASYSKIFVDDANNASLNTGNSDSDLVSANLNWQRALSPISQLRAGYQFQDFEREGIDQSTEFQRVYASFSRSLRLLSYNLTLGSNSSKSGSSRSNNGAFYQADISRDDGATQFSASASRQRSESSIGLSGLRFDTALSVPDAGDLGAGLTQENSNIQGEVDITFFDLDYRSTVNCRRCSYGAELSFAKNEYETNAAADDEVSSARLFFNYNLTRHTTLEINTDYSRTEFKIDGAQDDNSGGSLYLNWNATPNLRIELGGGYDQEEADTGANYYNTYGSLGLQYDLFKRN